MKDINTRMMGLNRRSNICLYNGSIAVRSRTASEREGRSESDDRPMITTYNNSIGRALSEHNKGQLAYDFDPTEKHCRTGIVMQVVFPQRREAQHSQLY
jgi:hypothetical protein